MIALRFTRVELGLFDCGCFTDGHKTVAFADFGSQNQDAYRTELRKSDSVVSCIGGFGKTDAYMGLVNGEANIKLAEVCTPDKRMRMFPYTPPVAR